MSRAVASVDLDAVGANLDRMREVAGPAEVMAIVKADAYGHGMVPVAAAARTRGIDWLGVALPSEALALRAAGDTGRVLAWLWAPGDPDVAACVAADVDLSVSSAWALDEVVAAARAAGRTARIHVKADTGLTRNGVPAEAWDAVIADVARAQAEGAVEVVGLWTHLADGDTPGAASVIAQGTRFDDAVAAAARAGVRPALQHVANSGAVFAYPDLRRDLVRVGIATYGLTPSPALGSAASLGLVPAMTLRARVAHVKRIGAGTAVSYGGTWAADRPTTVALVPLGYADGVPRAAGGRVEVALDGRRLPAVGRVAMDQFVVDLGGADASPGDEVVLFGPGTRGEPTADEWAAALDTIGYEIVTRIGVRVPRVHVGGTA